MDITLAKATATGGKGKPFMQITDITFKHKEEHKPVSDAVIKSIANLDLLIPQPPTYEEISAFMGNPATQASSEGELEEELVEEEEIVHTPPAKPAPAKATPAKKAAPAKKPEPKEEEETLLDDEESTEPTEEDGDVDEGDLDEIEGEEVVEEEETPPAPMKTPSGKTGKAPAKPIHDDLDKKPVPAPAKKGVAPTKAAPVKKAAPAPEPSDEDEFGGDFNED